MNEKRKKIIDEKVEEAKLKNLNQKKINLMGPVAKEFEQSKKEIKISNTAQAMEEFGKFFPVHFKRNLTRKMNILSIVGPRQVRDY